MGRLTVRQWLKIAGVSLGLTLPVSSCTSSSKSPEEASSSEQGPLVSQRTTGAIIPYAPRDQIISRGLYAPGSSTSVALWKTRATLGNRALSTPAELSLELLQGGGIPETSDLQLVAPIVRFQLKNSDGTTVPRESLRRDIVIESIVDRFVDQNNIVGLVLLNFGTANEERWLIESKHIQFQIAADQSRTIVFPMRDSDFVFALGAVRPRRMPQGWQTFVPPPKDGTNLSTSAETVTDSASEVTLTWTPPDGSGFGYMIKTSYAPFDSPGCADGLAVDSSKIKSIRQDFPEMESDSYTLSGLLDGQTAYVQLCTKNNRTPSDISEGQVIAYDVPKRALAQLSNAPTSYTNATSLNATVGGAGLTSYKYALLAGGTTCDTGVYSDWITIDTPMSNTLSETKYILCVLGKVSDTNVQQNPTIVSFQVDRTPPAAFSLIAPGAVLTNRKPSIPWNASTGADFYDIKIATDSGCNSVIKALTVNTAALTDEAVPDGNYYLCVTAKDAAGNSRAADGGSINFVVDATPPGSFSITAPSGSSAVYTQIPLVSWTNAVGAASYTYVVSDNSACTHPISTGQNVVGTSHSLSALVPGPYYLCVTARDSAGNQTTALNSGLAFDVDIGFWTALSPPGAALTDRTEALFAWAPSYGKLMIWGGRDSNGNAVGTGALYDISNDTWQIMSAINALSPRSGSTAIWSPAIMRLILWGGEDSNQNPLSNGAFYEPQGGWTPMSQVNAPLARKEHTAVLADSSMIVWGGFSCVGNPGCGNPTSTNTGGIFHIPSNSWQSGGTDTSDPDTPSPRRMHTAVWTGSVMIVWGGYNGSDYFNTGGRYTPGTPGEWTAVTTTNAPAPRRGHVAVWTGTKMLIWGGYGCANPPTCSQLGDLNDGRLYDPTDDSWSPINGSEGLSGRKGFFSAWDPLSQRLFVWGGDQGGNFLNDGGMISPTSSWIVPRVNSTGAPSARSGGIGIWTGSKFVVFGGTNGSPLGSGAIFTPP